MLAYTFWHWPRPGVGSADYERAQRAFHAALAEAPPAGFLGSRSAGVVGLPWAADGGPAYEDRYLVDITASLDALEEAAVTASRAAPHDAAAALAGGGAAGLYKLRLGVPPEVARHAWWFAKPAGMSYARLFELLGPVAARPDTALWMRQMVLGPTPEFCLQARGMLDLPDGLTAQHTALRPLWPIPASEAR